MYSDTELSEIVTLWQKDFKAIHPERVIEGSPERTEFRMVVEDARGDFFILENISSHLLLKKEIIVQTLNYLNQKGLEGIHPYLKNKKDDNIVSYKDSFWQMVPFIKGEALDRENYIYEEWRGDVLAQFLMDLHPQAIDIPLLDKTKAFSIKDFIYDLLKKLKTHNPELLPELMPAVNHLEQKFMIMYDQFPLTFCHGDYHPLNVIWGKDHMKSVIDWEFLGYKPEIYDVANMIGCVGMENPDCLTQGLVPSFVKKMRATDLFSPQSWEYLMEFVIALRFAWFSEWLHKHDQEMVELEGVYINLLLDRSKELRSCWI